MKTIEMALSSRYERDMYNIRYRSKSDHHIHGAKHNPRARFLITAYGDTRRPNNKGTDEHFSVTTSAQATIISAQPIARRDIGIVLEIGDLVELLLPSGARSGPWKIEQRPLHDPHLTPQDV